jgi:hypothetical protein
LHAAALVGAAVAMAGAATSNPPMLRLTATAEMALRIASPPGRNFADSVRIGTTGSGSAGILSEKSDVGNTKRGPSRGGTRESGPGQADNSLT